MNPIRRFLSIFSWRNFTAGWSVFWRGVLVPAVLSFLLVLAAIKVLNDMDFAVDMRSYIVLALLIAFFLIFLYLFNWAVRSRAMRKDASFQGVKYFWWSVLWRWLVVGIAVDFVFRIIIELSKSLILTLVLVPVQLYCVICILGWAFTKAFLKTSIQGRS